MPIYFRGLDGFNDGAVRGEVSQGNRSALFRGGVKVAVGDLTSDAPLNGIYVSRISLINAPFEGLDAVDWREAGVVNKTRTMFHAAKSFGLANEIVVAIPRASRPNKMLHSNNLKQMALASVRRFPVAQLFVNDVGNPKGVIIRLENVLVGDASTEEPSEIPATQSFSLNFTKIIFEYKP